MTAVTPRTVQFSYRWGRAVGVDSLLGCNSTLEASNHSWLAGSNTPISGTTGSFYNLHICYGELSGTTAQAWVGSTLIQVSYTPGGPSWSTLSTTALVNDWMITGTGIVDATFIPVNHRGEAGAGSPFAGRNFRFAQSRDANFCNLGSSPGSRAIWEPSYGLLGSITPGSKYIFRLVGSATTPVAFNAYNSPLPEFHGSLAATASLATQNIGYSDTFVCIG